MTAAERFESNLDIAAGVARGMSRRFRHYDYDDLYAMALVGLWDCAVKYRDDGRAKFTSYANTYVPLRIVDQIRVEQGRLGANGSTKNDDAKMAVRYPIGGEVVTDVGTVIDIVEMQSASEDPDYEEVELQIIFSDYIASLKPKMRKAIHLRLSGLKLAEIAREMGVTESRVSQWLTAIRPDLDRRLHAVG